MNQVMEALLNRRSIRAFEEKANSKRGNRTNCRGWAVCSKWNGTPGLGSLRW